MWRGWAKFFGRDIAETLFAGDFGFGLVLDLGKMRFVSADELGELFLVYCHFFLA